MIQGEYLVTGKREYRGTPPGQKFIARLDRGAERRAIERGDIRLLRHVDLSIQRRHLRFPDGWLPADPEPMSNEAPEGASNVGRSK